MGFSLGAIPLSEIKAYCEMFDITGEERHDLVVLIRALDDEYLLISHQKSTKRKSGE